MAHKSALVFAVVALLSVANAASVLTTSSFTTASFNVTPVAVVNSTDTVFYNKILGQSVQFGAGSDNTTNYMYGKAATTGSGPYATVVTRRKLNSTTQASLGDETLSLSCGANDLETYVGGQGTFAASCSGDAAGFNNLHLYTFTAASTTAKDTTLTAATTTDNTFTVNKVWYDDGAMIWYVVFTKIVAADSKIAGLLIQAVNVSNGTNTLLYAAGGVAIYTPAANVAAADWGSVSASPNNVTNATTASVTYKDATTVGANGALLKLVPVTLSTGAPGSAVTIGTDASTQGVDANPSASPAVVATPFKSVMNTPVGLGCSYSTYLAGVYQVEQNGPDAATTPTTTKKVFIFYNGSSTSTENYTVTTDSLNIAGVQYGGGYSIFQFAGTTSTGTTAVSYINYFGNGSYNASSTSTSVGSFTGTFGMWLDSNGALWVGAANYETTASQTSPVTTDMVSDASVGKLFGQVYLFANTLSSVFAFVALMVAALFAF